MKKSIIVILSTLCLSSVLAFAQMSDSQVVDYVKSGVASGKSQEQMARELIARGVTREQLERLKEQYSNASAEGNAGADAQNKKNPRQTAVKSRQTDRRKVSDNDRNIDDRYIDRNSVRNSVRNSDRYVDEYDSEYYGEDYQENMLEDREPATSSVFGVDIFRGRELSFEPNENIATPSDYVLGPGDELIIEIWGYNEASINQTISPEGRINISQIGPIYLNGLTISEASNKIKKALVSKYSSIGGDTPNTSVSVSLGSVRTIQVNVMGEVNTPGTYRLSSFATVFNALYNAQGVTDNGSLRAIKVVRGGKQVATVDFYGYLFNGKSDSDIRLKDGDIIIVPPYINRVTVAGEVKRPMKYEMTGEENLSDLIRYAGGFSSDSYRENVNVSRINGKERELSSVAASGFASFIIADGDSVNVAKVLDRYTNRVTVEGAVMRPGYYQIGGDVATLRQLIEKAGGLREDAFLKRAVITRENDDLTLRTISVELSAVMGGKSEDVLLRKNDIVTVISNSEMQAPGTLTINGYVANPGTFTYSKNATVEDLIIMAGGLLDGASTAKVDIARRIYDPESLEAKDELGVSLSISIENGKFVSSDPSFKLQPYDVVSVRRSPGYRPQQFVKVSGEVSFPGDYLLINVGERLSSLVARAGGATSHAYLKGATLKRAVGEEERKVLEAKKKLAARSAARDSLMVDDESDAYFNVAIMLDLAIANPGSEYDIILKEGDELTVPEELNTVKVSGAVMNPNVMSYVPGRSAREYINAAGGYGLRAKRSRAYIVYMNGSVAKAGRIGVKVEPGCEIIVPQKEDSQKMTTGEVMSIATSAASLSTVIITLVNLLK